MKFLFILSLLLTILSPTLPQQPDQREMDALKQWRAAEVVSQRSVELFGEEKIWLAEPISEQVFARMQGLSYKEDCRLPLDSLRYLKLLHRDAEGRICLGEMVCHRAVSESLIAIFKELYEAHYPIERMVLIDNYGADDELSMRANNTSAFNYRLAAGSATVLSSHSMGTAVDINPLYNPYVKEREGRTIVEPSTAREYVDRTKSFPYKIVSGDLCHRLMLRHGFEWGGSWRSVKDYQHFEKRLKK